MRIVTANKRKKLILSKTEWEKIGKKAGWMKTSSMSMKECIGKFNKLPSDAPERLEYRKRIQDYKLFHNGKEPNEKHKGYIIKSIMGGYSSYPSRQEEGISDPAVANLRTEDGKMVDLSPNFERQEEEDERFFNAFK